MSVKHFSGKVQAILTYFVGGLLLVLAGCGVSTDTGTDPNTPTLINSFSVTASDGATGSFVAMDFGDASSMSFTLDWDVSSSDPYHVRLYLSNDANIGAGDVLFLDTMCGTHPDYICKFQGSQVCGINLGLNDILECPNNTAVTSSADITLRLGGLPVSSLINFIIFEACNSALDSCLTASVQVQIYDSSP